MDEKEKSRSSDFKPEDVSKKIKFLESLKTDELDSLYRNCGFKDDAFRFEKIDTLKSYPIYTLKAKLNDVSFEIKNRHARKLLIYSTHIEVIMVGFDLAGVSYQTDNGNKKIVEDSDIEKLNNAILRSEITYSQLKKIFKCDIASTSEEYQVTAQEYFAKRRTKEECIMLLNMCGWDIENSADVENMKEELMYQDFEVLFNLYKQLKNIK